MSLKRRREAQLVAMKAKMRKKATTQKLAPAPASRQQETKTCLLSLLYHDLVIIVLAYCCEQLTFFQRLCFASCGHGDGELWQPRSLSFTEDKELVVVDNSRVQIFHTSNGRFLRSLSWPQETIRPLQAAFSKSELFLLHDRRTPAEYPLRVYDSRTMERKKFTYNSVLKPSCLHVTDHHLWLYQTGETRGYLTIVPRSKNASRPCGNDMFLLIDSRGASKIIVRRDAQAVFALKNSTVEEIDVSKQAASATTFFAPRSFPTSLCFTLRGDKEFVFASAHGDNNIHISVRVANGQEIHKKVIDGVSSVSDITTSPAGELIVLDDRKGEVRIFE
jgi:WD40 repeat protein